MLYKQAFDQAYQQSDYFQAFYNGINVAILELALYRNRCSARQIAVHVLRQCRLATKEKWCLATEGKAQLYPSKVDYYTATLILEPDLSEIKLCMNRHLVGPSLGKC